ncbi:ribonuclease H-like domain-containing protein [Tanacetum coccineum]
MGKSKTSIEVPTSIATTTPCSTPFLLAEQIHQLLNLLNNSKNSNKAHAYMGEKLENIMDISDLKLQIDHPNGITAYIKEVGNLRLSDIIILYDVLYVPEYSVNLLSVHKLARDSKLFIGFDEHKCYIQDLQAQKTLGLVVKEKAWSPIRPNLLSNDDSEARNHGSENRSLHVDGTKTVNNTSISNSEAIHDEDGTEPLDNVHTSFDSDSGATQKDHILLYQIDNNIVEPSSTSKGNSYNIQNVVNETVSQRRSGRTSKLPTKLSDFVLDNKVKYGIDRIVNYSKLSKENYCFASNLNKTFEPKTFREACNNKEWVNAMNNEIEALNRNETWEITELPPGRKPIGCKWIYKAKYKSNGDIERYKARLVAKGFN